MTPNWWSCKFWYFWGFGNRITDLIQTFRLYRFCQHYCPLTNITRPCIRIVYFIYITYLVKLYLVLLVLQFPDVPVPDTDLDRTGPIRIPSPFCIDLIWAESEASMATKVSGSPPLSSLHDPRRLVGVHREHISNISSTDFPGHYPNEDNSWDLVKFKNVCR